MPNPHDNFVDFTEMLSNTDFIGHVAKGVRIGRLDLMSEICLRFPGSESRFVAAINPDAYLARTARNIAKTLYRKDCRFRDRHCSLAECDSVGSESSVAQNEFEKREARALLRAAVARLPEPYRNALVACLLDGQSPREYASLRSIAYENVRVMLRRAKSTCCAADGNW